MKSLNRYIAIVEKMLSKNRLRVFKSIYFNFRTLPFSTAIRLPILIYGKVHLYSLAGTVVINGKIKTGMIQLGYAQGYFSGPKGCAMVFLSENAVLEFNGPCKIDFDYCIRISDNGHVKLGENIGFGSDIKIYCEDYISIGNYCRIPFGTCFMDTNYHYSVSLPEMVVYNKKAPIIIEDYCWIGNTSTIMKGTVLPKGSIVASKSFLNKDFRKLSNGEENLVIAGSPASIVRTGMTRVHNIGVEQKITVFFAGNSGQKTYSDAEELKKYRNI